MERVKSKHIFNYQLDGVLDDEVAAESQKMMENFDMTDPANAILMDPSGADCLEFAKSMRSMINKLMSEAGQHHFLAKEEQRCTHSKIDVPPRDGNDYTVPVHMHTPDGLEGQEGNNTKGNAAVIYAHGGGTIGGTAELFQPWQSSLAVHCGVVYFSVDYRLAPETKCPKNALDFYCAVKHIIENASALGIDADRIAISGESGGGYIVMATMVMLAQRDEGHLVKLAIPGIPMIDDYAFGDPSSMTREEKRNVGGFRKLWECLATDLDEQRKTSDPLLFPAKASDELLAKMPPTIIWEVEFDIYITEATRMANRLRAAGRLLEFYVAPGVDHGGDMNPDLKVFHRNREDWKRALESYLL